MPGISKTGLFCGVAFAIAYSSAAWAQDVPEPRDESETNGDIALEEDIVVTATRAETLLQRTPIAVTALSAEALEERNVTSLLDVANFVPNLSIGSRSGTGAAGGGVSIRGMGVDATDSQAAVGTYIDDVFFASGRGNILGLMDTQRVEVLRGPQGTLFGRNTIAGAIQYVTQAPSSEFGGYLTGTLGNYDRGDIRAALNIPLGDTFAVRIAAMHSERDGYIHDNFTGEDRGAEEISAARIRARWTPTDRLTVDLKGEVVDQDTNGRPVLVTAVNPNAQFPALAALGQPTFGIPGVDLSSYGTFVSSDESSFGGFDAPDYFKFNYASGQLTVSYDLTDSLSIRSISAYSSYRARLAQDLDNTPLPILSLSAPRDNTEVFTQEFQLQGSAFSDRLDFTLGAYYFDLSQRVNPNFLITLGNFPAFDFYGSPGTNIQSEALYGRVNFDLTEQLSIDLGVRYTHEENESFLIGETAPLSSTFSNLSPHLGVNFQATDDMMFYAKASRGFRAGGFTANRALSGGGNAFDPETAWTYEAGARLELFNGRLRVNPTAFLTEWNDIQFNRLVITPGGPAVTTDNAGDAEITGFELETQFAATDRLQFSASLSLLDGEYTRVEALTYDTFPTGWSFNPFIPPFGASVPNSVVTLPAITLDTPLQRAPEVKYTVGARYTHPLPGDANLVASAVYSWTDDQMAGVTNADQIEMPSYGLLSARLQYNAPGDRWSLAAFGTNITDEFYLIGGVAFARGYTAGADESDPGRPQEYGVELTVNF